MALQAIANINNHDAEVALRVIEQEIQGLAALKSVINYQFIKVINLLAGTQGRIVVSGVGKSGHIAKKIVATFSSTGSPALFIHPSEASHGDLGMIAENDTVILLSNSGQTSELNCLIDYCKRFGIIIISIVGDANSTLAKASDYCLVLPKVEEASSIGAPTTSSTMMLALGDAIAVVLHEKKQFTKADFKVLHPGGSIGARLIKVYDIMHKGDEIPLILHDKPALNALIEMSAKRLGCVGIVSDNGDFMGILTDGDIRRHINFDFKHNVISEIMTRNPITISSNICASEALHIMSSKKITNIFVLEGTKPIGIIHMHDILRAKVV